MERHINADIIHKLSCLARPPWFRNQKTETHAENHKVATPTWHFENRGSTMRIMTQTLSEFWLGVEKEHQLIGQESGGHPSALHHVLSLWDRFLCCCIPGNKAQISTKCCAGIKSSGIKPASPFWKNVQCKTDSLQPLMLWCVFEARHMLFILPNVCIFFFIYCTNRKVFKCFKLFYVFEKGIYLCCVNKLKLPSFCEYPDIFSSVEKIWETLLKATELARNWHFFQSNTVLTRLTQGLDVHALWSS